MTQIKELAQLLKKDSVRREDYAEIYLCGPDDIEPVEYLTYDEKLVVFDNGYHISDINQSHATIFFKTKEEVLCFFEGYCAGGGFAFDDDNEVANSVGQLLYMSEQFKNAMEEKLSHLISNRKQDKNDLLKL